MTAAPSLPGFDVAAYVRDPIELRPSTLDVDATAPLAPEVLAVVEHLWSVERGILDLLRDLLVTPTHSESRVTAFLNTWAYEQYWLAQTLAAVIEANGGDPADRSPSPLGAMRRFWDERVTPMLNAVRSNMLGEDVVAAQMAMGWLSTAVLGLGYERLAELEPRLTALSESVRPLKARHLAFYADDARARLARSPQGRTLARRFLGGWEWPEVRYAGRAAVRPIVVTLYRDSAAAPRLRAIDDALAALPGLEGLTPVRQALGRFVSR